MPRKVRELEEDLRAAGFARRPGKGSHRIWQHPLVPELAVSMSGGVGDDAADYQERNVRKALADVGRAAQDRRGRP